MQFRQQAGARPERRTGLDARGAIGSPLAGPLLMRLPRVLRRPLALEKMGCQRDVDCQPGACAARGLDVYRAAEGLEPLAHADQPQAGAPRRLHVEPDSVVGDCQRELVRDTAQVDVLVLESVVESLEERRDTYAMTLDDDSREAYEKAFGRAARKRFPTLTAAL